MPSRSAAAHVHDDELAAAAKDPHAWPRLAAIAPRMWHAEKGRIELNPFQRRVLEALETGGKDGGPAREVWAMAGNRAGKSFIGALWAVAGALGDNEGAVTWCVCESGKVQREGPQPHVLRALATHEIRRRGNRPAISQFSGKIDRIDTTGGVLQFRNYCDGPASVVGASVRRAWLDEEPDYAYYKELRTRLVDTGGRILVTLTAVNGRTPLMQHVLEERPDVVIVTGSMRDNVLVLGESAIRDFEATLDEWEREVRIGGRVLPLGGRPFIPGAVLAALKPREPIRVEELHGVRVEIYEEPERMAAYTLGADAAEGVGRDRGALSVHRVGFGEASRQVAAASSDVRPDQLAAAVGVLATRYKGAERSAMVAPEANGPGLVLLDRLEGSGLRIMPRPQSVDGAEGGTPRLGFLTTGRTRPMLLERLRQRLIAKGLVIRSHGTVESLGSFVWNSKRPEAATGCWDDPVIACALAEYAEDHVRPPAPSVAAIPKNTPAAHLARLRAQAEADRG